MPTVLVKGKGLVTLSDSKDFKAEGGEASIYVQGKTVYKIWKDTAQMVNPAKVQELQKLAEPYIIIPQDVLLDQSGRKPIGITMKNVENAYVLCQIFPKAFRDRNSLSPETILSLVRKLQSGVSFVHSKDMLIVDLNEMNFLVDKNFKDIFFIDTTTYQTPSFPATALMESVRDRHSKGFNRETDWFAFAVVSFNMFIGMHPYRGKYPQIDNSVPKESRMDARMQANVSALHKDVRLPGACLPFSVIPNTYLEWYKAVLQEGKRIAPPSDLQATVQISTPAVIRITGSDKFEFTLIREYDSEILSYFDDIAITQKSIYIGKEQKFSLTPDAKISITRRVSHVVVAYIKDEVVNFYDITSGAILSPLPLTAESLMSYEGRLYVKSIDKIFELIYLENSNGKQLLPGTRMVANCMPNSTQTFDGVYVQRMLGSYHAIFVPKSETSYQVRLKEIEDYRIVDAKHSKGVLIIIGIKSGKYSKFLYRFSPDYQDHNVRETHDITYTGINFTVREDGMVLHLNENDELEVFKNRMDSTGFTTIADPALTGDYRLASHGVQSLLIKDNKILRFSAKK